MVQLWVNLPAQHKMAPPRYQAIASTDIPSAPLGDDSGSIRVIAGTLAGATGPARTFTPIEVGDVRLPAGAHAAIVVPDGHTTALVVLRGAVRVNDSEAVRGAEVGLFDRAGSRIVLDDDEDATALLLGGAPIEEPIVGHGPFVMNTQGEIRQAMLDYRDGRMGHLAAG
jgi:redox-sensitive bicupin YhaK (pirin superfamily)